MTALSSEAHNGATNGYTNGSAEHNNNNNNNHSTMAVSGAPAFANNAFSHLTLYTGNTMRTGTTGQLNTSLKKSNQEVRTTDPILFLGGEGRQTDTQTVQEEKRAGKLRKRVFNNHLSTASQGPLSPIHQDGNNSTRE